MIIIGIAGKELQAHERDWLRNDACAGVCLFSRNFASREQVTQLCADIRAAVNRPILVTVDQEGGRVQRFRDGYSKLPPLQSLEAEYAKDPQAALKLAEEHAWLMASEIRATGIDLSFAPVVDLGRGNKAIGNRAFAEKPEVVAEFTRVYVRAMHEAGMPATLKHFPGHGTVQEDTHFDEAVDPRPLDVMLQEDLLPFAAGIEAGADAVMMAHVRYPAVDDAPAGVSKKWIGDILRGAPAKGGMNFRGVVFSDDIGMAGAGATSVKARIDAHLDAGCDLVLACHPDIAEEALKSVQDRKLNTASIVSLIGRGALGWAGLLADNRYTRVQRQLEPLLPAHVQSQHTQKGLA